MFNSRVINFLERFINKYYNHNLMMKRKTDILPKTIDSEIVIAGLRALSSLEDYAVSRSSYLIVGGTAVQSYIPIVNRRPTSDIDLSVVRPLNYEDFKTFIKPVFEYLQDGGYPVEMKKRDNRFQLLVHTSDAHDSLAIEFSRRNKDKFAQVSSRLERELMHGRMKNILGTSSSYLVAAPEDIAVPKLVRGIGTLERLPELYPELTLIYQEDPKFSGILSHVVGERAVANANRKPAQVEAARLKADLYDILTLSAFVGFNNSYFTTAAQEWNKLTTPSDQRKFLLRLLRLQLETSEK